MTLFHLLAVAAGIFAGAVGLGLYVARRRKGIQAKDIYPHW